MLSFIFQAIRRHSVAGLIVWLPLFATFVTIRFIVGLFDGLLLYLPPTLRPENWLGFDIPGLALIMAILIVYLTGVLASNLLGRQLVKIGESLLDGIPIIRSLYRAIKQMTEAVLSAGGQTFEKAYLIEYPKEGLWTIAFQTSKKRGEAQKKVGDDAIVNLFVPTTPNPTSGYFIMVSADKIIELDMSIDDALKMIVSGGVFVPPDGSEK